MKNSQDKAVKIIFCSFSILWMISIVLGGKVFMDATIFLLLLAWITGMALFFSQK